jgi:hypothetical protein
MDGAAIESAMRNALISLLIGFAFGGLAHAGEREQTVVVIRGTNSTVRPDASVVVLRPPRGSFLRETTRLAADADAREARMAVREALDSSRLLSEVLEAVIASADATRYGTTSDFAYPYVWMTGRRPPPRRNNITLAPVGSLPTGSTPQ